MFSLDAPVRAEGQPLLPAIWRGLHPAARETSVALAPQVAALGARVRDLEARLGQDSSHSSRPPSRDPPDVPARAFGPRLLDGVRTVPIPDPQTLQKGSRCCVRQCEMCAARHMQPAHDSRSTHLSLVLLAPRYAADVAQEPAITFPRCSG